MQSKNISIYSLLLVIGVHAGVLAAVVLSPSAPMPIVVEPTIQGMLVMAEPEEAPPPNPLPLPPPPEKKPEPKPKPKPLPKAPPSERAVEAPEPEPVSAPTEEPVKEQPTEPAPVVLPPRTDASEQNNPAPVYPAISKRLGEKGIVSLEILVKADGTVGEVKVKKSSGYKRLDTAAITAIKRWRFIAASENGISIDYWYEIDFDFGLRKPK